MQRSTKTGTTKTAATKTGSMTMMTMTWAMAAIAAILGASACSATAEESDPGVETGPCIAGECFDGLMCLSDLCVGDDALGSDGDDGNPGDGSPDDGNPDDGDPDDGNPDDGNPDDGNPDDGNPDDGNPDDGNPDDGNPDDDGGGCADEPGVPLGGACDPIAQDCGGCAKCTPWGTNGTWDAARCVGVNDNPAQIGESCVAIESATSGVDNCELGALCWNVDNATLMGECIELCSGTLNNPSCDTAGTVCAAANNGLLPLCLDACDPLDGACPSGEGCYIVVDAPVCAPTVGNSGSGDSCNSLNACNDGYACVSGGGGCEPTQSCCGQYCDLAEPACGVDQQCTMLTDEVGACAAPM